MKQPIQSSAVVLALALPLAFQGVAAKKAAGGASGGAASAKSGGSAPQRTGNNQVKGGNTQQTTYDFKNDKFGNGDVLNFNTQNYAQGGQTGARSRKARRSIFARDADGSAHNGKDGGIFARYAEPEAFMDGGSAKGGSSHTSGGNHASNSNSLSGAQTGKGGNINMQSASQQKGGNTLGGNGGANYGNGGNGGSANFMLPIPFRKRDLYDDEFELYAREAFMDGGSAKGGNSKTNGGNHASNSNTLKGAKTGKGGNINMQSASQQKGGNTIGGNGGANYGFGGNGGSASAMLPIPFRKRDLYDDELELFAREAFMNGGGAKGGDSKTKGGNYASNSNTVKGAKTGKGGNINMQSASQQSGGNTMGGSGGVNAGSGGSGGGFGFSLFRRALGLDDDELALDLYARYAEPEAEAFMNGGSAKGGDSHTSGGNYASNSNTVKGAKTSGGNINMQSLAQQKGGNTFGGNGGANAGSGGSGGGFGFSLFRREFDDLEARDLEDIVELVARYAEAEAEAYAEPEADAEPEFEWDEYDLY